MTFYKSTLLGLIGSLACAIKIAHPHTDEELEKLGLANCQCLSSNGIAPTFMDGEAKLRVYTGGSCTPMELPLNFGTETCIAWFMGLEEMGCGGANPPKACEQPWCYVSSECEAADTQPSSFNEDVSFSLLACGADMTLAANPNRKSQDECAAEEAAQLEAARQAAIAAQALMDAQDALAAALAAGDAAAAQAAADDVAAAAMAAQDAATAAAAVAPDGGEPAAMSAMEAQIDADTAAALVANAQMAADDLAAEEAAAAAAMEGENAAAARAAADEAA